MFPAAARWYLAAVATLALLAIAMQFFIQAHAQQRADQLLHEWAKRAHVQIGRVRYHLLRNGLILHDIHIRRGDDHVDIGQILLRADPQLLTGAAPRIGMVDISALHAEITHAGDAKVWQHDVLLGKIWQAAVTLQLHDGDIALYRDGRDRPALKLHGLSLRQHLQGSLRSMTGAARTEQGDIAWQWRQHTAAWRRGDAGGALPQGWLMQGALHWHGLDAGRLLQALRLKTIAGHLDGDVTWQRAAADGDESPALSMHGRLQLYRNQAGSAGGAHQLRFSASASGGRWHGDAEAVAWPLDPWAEKLPDLGGRQLIAAQLDGRMRWQVKSGNWSVRSDKGVLQDVTYADPGSRAQSAWYWSRIRYHHAVIDAAAQQVQFASLDMRDSRLVLPMPHERHWLAGMSSGWRIHAASVDVHNMMLALNTLQGRLNLAGLAGEVRCPVGKPLHWLLQTKSTGSAPATPDADSVAPTWRLQGRAETCGDAAAWSSARLKVDGRQIPVARLRPLLILQDDADSPVKMTGAADLALTAGLADNGWQITGRATIHDARFEHGGDFWQSDQLDIRLGPVGPGFETQRVRRIESSGWQYVAAMHPLSPHGDHEDGNASDGAIAPASLADPNGEKGRPAWWAGVLQRNAIVIDRLSLIDGRISIGQPESVWARQVKLTVENIGAGQWAQLHMQGAVDGSPFYLKGAWQPLSGTPRFRGDAGIEQATPFFLRNWMHASGMPSLIRGRLSASLHIADLRQPPGAYQGKVKLQLLQGLTEPGEFAGDPMLARTGFTTPLLLKRLAHPAGVINLQYDLNGDWATAPLNMARLGDSVLDAMRQAALNEAPHKQQALEKQKFPVSVVARIRLHDHERLSQNERNRLTKVVRLLRQHPEMIVDLRGRWTGESISAQMLQRIRYTQQLIEDFIVYRKIDKRRIFPLWPLPSDRASEAGSVQLETRVSG